jgi:glycosyltransferase involved in cell wall biosynthesis
LFVPSTKNSYFLDAFIRYFSNRSRRTKSSSSTNASTDRTAAAASIPGIRVVDEPRKGLVVARETGRRVSTGDVLVYVDGDCRAPRDWLERVAREFSGSHPPVAVTGPYRFYDWDIVGRMLVRMYDYSLAPLTHVLAQHVFRLGAVLYGGNFAVRRDALEAIGGFDTSIKFRRWRFSITAESLGPHRRARARCQRAEETRRSDARSPATICFR